ncbi:hypothetical protein Syun_016667 [Stephania yunnanensis]|uniref:SDR family oxidoreductase n=1 Tax=Stephania yunnanensis TaxID=152371 RepID=A0AAP0P465_9MAGN
MCLPGLLIHLLLGDLVVMMSSPGITVYWFSARWRALAAKDRAEAALYLASDESRYVGGHNLLVDGGFITGTTHFMDY